MGTLPENGSRTARFLSPLALILITGALVRLALWGWFSHEAPHIWDEKDYDLLAINLVKHGEFAFTPGTPISLRPPLYPTVIAGVYWVFGLENYQAARLLQAVLSLLTVVVLYRLASEVCSRRVALWLAGLCCFYPSMLGFNNLLLTETLFTFLLSAACYAVVLFYKREAMFYLGAAGCLLGLAALTRSVVWLSPPCLAVFLLLTWKAPWRRRLLATAVLVASATVTLAPWAIRNTRLERTFVVVDTMGGRNFMMGNYEFTPLYRSWDAISLTGERAWDRVLFAAHPPATGITQGEVDKLAFRHGLAFVRENPWLTLHRDLIKFFDFWGLERELVAGAGQGYFGQLPKPALLLLTLLIFGSYAVVMILSVFGMVLTPLADRRVHWFLLLVVAYVCGMHTLVFAHSRYHLPIMPLVLVFAASAVVNLRHVWEERRHWRFWVAAGLSCVLVAGWVWGLVAGDLERFLSIVQSA
jgi:4-amino-4-deoxy-L-arabinose transferase-like glycosyltransferase